MMLIRLLRKLILAVSVLLAIALLGLWFGARRSDLVIAGASGGRYRELRLARSQLALTFVTVWTNDDRTRLGRVQSHGIGAGSGRPIASETFSLLDGSLLTLRPDPPKWWPPTRSTGSALLDTGRTVSVPVHSETATLNSGIMTFNSLTVTATQAAVIKVTFGSSNDHVAEAVEALREFGTRLPGSGNATTSVSGGGSSSSSDGSSGSGTMGITSTGSFNISTGSNGGSIADSNTLTITRPILFAGLAYERYRLPLWTVVLILLLPVWSALALASLRWGRRRVRRKRGLCERCGYDLRGNPASAACPECGSAVGSSFAAQAPADVAGALKASTS